MKAIEGQAETVIFFSKQEQKEPKVVYLKRSKNNKWPNVKVITRHILCFLADRLCIFSGHHFVKSLSLHNKNFKDI
tara:strand:- start:358 stop:585 length:228 start_codon:yes stop_codon:yes gene_type:complete